MGVRNSVNFDFSDYCGLDFDDTISIDDAIGIFKDYRAVIATTKNHRKRKKGVIADRFRVIVPWERRITCRHEYVQNMTSVIKEYEADGACKDAGRFFNPSLEIVFANDNELFPVAPYQHAKRSSFQHDGGTPAWLLDMVARGVDGEQGRNVAGFKIAAAAFRCGKSSDEILNLLNNSYGVESLSESEKKAIVRSAMKIRG
jgi:hypothetical protein